MTPAEYCADACGPLLFFLFFLGGSAVDDYCDDAGWSTLAQCVIVLDVILVLWCRNSGQ